MRSILKFCWIIELYLLIIIMSAESFQDLWIACCWDISACFYCSNWLLNSEKSHWWLFECLCRVKGGLRNTVRAIATMSLPSLTKIKMWLYPPGDYSTKTVMMDINIHVGIWYSTSIKIQQWASPLVTIRDSGV
jgi:hypothetical protein